MVVGYAYAQSGVMQLYGTHYSIIRELLATVDEQLSKSQAHVHVPDCSDDAPDNVMRRESVIPPILQ